VFQLEENRMEWVLLVIAVLCVMSWVWSQAYKEGKRIGSRKGYGVGFDRGRRSRTGNSSDVTGLIFLALLPMLVFAMVKGCR
jgi:hypothetical protein